MKWNLAWGVSCRSRPGRRLRNRAANLLSRERAWEYSVRMASTANMACAALRMSLLLLALAHAARASSADGLVAEPLITFSIPGAAGLHMPTGVAVASDGAVYVADGANRRIVVFDPSGRRIDEIRSVGDATLVCPVSVAVDAVDQLWIADSGLHEVLVRTQAGDLLQRITLQSSPYANHSPAATQPDAPHAGSRHVGADVTGVAVRADGAVAWIVDNDGHRLARLNVADGSLQYFAEAGENLGQLSYPFMAAVTAGGDVLVTDVLNGRVQVFSDAGRPVQAIGSYGVDIGNLYRPKGVAVDSSGNVFVTDGTLGVVQAFRENGIVIDVVRDASGQPLRLDTPSGLAFDREGFLYVVELGASRVRKFRLAPTAAPAAPGRAAAAGPAAGKQRACTACHVEWMEPIASGLPTPLMEAPRQSPQEPLVSRAETCLSCHDASVVDSRERVWFEHGHRTGVAPPDGMRVPRTLPLVDGRLACRTCHSAHAGGAPQGDLRTSVFLRVSNVAGELCVQCHVNMTRGPGFGTHPTGGMPFPIPQELIDAGARLGPNPRELTCQTCHTPHGAKADHLLVKGASNNELCLTCHDQMRPGMFLPGGPSEHPINAKANPAQTAAVQAMGSRLSDGGALICLTCHKLHEGHGRRFMLAADLAEGQMCLGCHDERRSVLNTSHDLRGKFPGERNRLGMTVREGGPCSACHLFHRYARDLAPTPLDIRGQCVTCHQEGQCGEKRRLGDANHPGVQCAECHDPHSAAHPSFLKAEGEQLCIQCHVEQAAVRGGPHDMTLSPSGTDPTTGGPVDRCLACHRPHGDGPAGRWRHRLSPKAEGADAICVGCHAGVVWNSGGALAVAHPQQGDERLLASGLPLVAGHEAEAAARIGCRTCHNPHAAHANNPSLLRVAALDGTQLCTSCHSDMQSLAESLHRPETLRAAGFNANGCRPCHTVHAGAEALAADLLWPKTLLASAAAPGTNISDPYCSGCHGAAGAVRRPAVATHPTVAMIDVGDQPSALPLFDENGQPSPTGSIRCRTCHLPHGRPEAPQLKIRPFTTPNVCTTCHPGDALERFLYFHNPQRRQ